MIIVKNRELLIPNNERYIGTTYDNDTENRVFQVPRFSQRGVDLANLTFRLDIQYANEAFDTVVLGKEVGEAFIILIWRITSAALQVPGTMYIGLRAIDDEATVKWSSFSAAMYAERHLNTPGNYGGSLTEIEQIEQDHQYMKGVIDNLNQHIAYKTADAEAWARGTREGHPVDSEDETYQNNAKYYSDLREEATHLAEAWARGTLDGVDLPEGETGYHDNAKYWKIVSEGWAHGGTGTHTNEQTDNSKYWSEISHAYANQVSYKKVYANVAEMVADTELVDGQVVRTLGYYAVNDGGGALYRIESTAPGTKYETLANGLYSKLVSEINICPEMFGTYGDGTHDDTSAFQSAVNYAVSKRCNFIANGQYLVSDTISVVSNASDIKNLVFDVNGTLISNFNTKPVILFSDCAGWKINVNVKRTVSAPFGGYNFSTSNPYHYGVLPNVGVVLRNANRCEFSGIIYDCNVGLRLEGLNGGCVYNFVHGVSVWNCAYGIELYANTSGWVNNNRFDANMVSIQSGVANRDKAVAIHLFSAYNYQNNCNLFEGDYMATDYNPAILVEKGRYNEFFLRNEGANKFISDEGQFNYFYTNHITTQNDIMPGANVDVDAIGKLMNSFEKVADIDSSNVDTVAWKAAISGYYAKCGNIVDYGIYASSSGNFTDESYGETSPTIDGIPKNCGVFVDIKKTGVIIMYADAYNSTDDMRLLVYLFDDNKNIISPDVGYINSAFGGNLTKDLTNKRLVSGDNASGKENVALLSSDVRYVFVTAARDMKSLRVYARKYKNAVPCLTHYSNKFKYPYLPINNINIKTSMPMIGKRLYSTVDGAEYVCTAVTDGVETWVKKTAT